MASPLQCDVPSLRVRPQGVKDSAKYDAVFGEPSRRNVVYFTTQESGGNVLTSSVLAEVLHT